MIFFHHLATFWHQHFVVITVFIRDVFLFSCFSLFCLLRELHCSSILEMIASVPSVNSLFMSLGVLDRFEVVVHASCCKFTNMLCKSITPDCCSFALHGVGVWAELWVFWLMTFDSWHPCHWDICRILSSLISLTCVHSDFKLLSNLQL